MAANGASWNMFWSWWLYSSANDCCLSLGKVGHGFGATDTSQEKGLQCEEMITDITRVGDPKRAPECCIYKVPKRVRKVKEEAYTPKLISIGPVHHNKGELKDMQMVKERYFKAFFSRTSQGQKEFARIIEDNDEKICECYAPEI